MTAGQKTLFLLAFIHASACTRSTPSPFEGPADAALGDAGSAPDVNGSTGGTAGGGASGGAGAGAGGAGGARSCPGYVPRGPFPCRTASECPGPVPICSPNPASGCGFRPMPMRQCFSDADCAGGLCVEGTMQPCATQPDTICIQRCTTTSCAAGARCAATGRCEIIPCTDGFACPSGTHCQAGMPGTDGHGCVLDDCAAGAWTCPQDQRCQAPGDARGCRCANDNACPINTRCHLDVTSGFGCLPKTCNVDADCDCGVCIGHGCEPGLWACQLAVP